MAIAWLGGLATGCGPQIELESGEGSTGEPPPGTTTTETPSTTTVTTTPPPPQTTDTTLDTGEFDTGEPWLDFPEHCSVLDQNCPPGFKCTPYASDGGASWNDAMCVPIVEDPNLPGEPCTAEGNGLSGIDDCDGTSMCWDVDPETGEGTCTAYCIGGWEDPHCFEPCFDCYIAGDGFLALCFPTCDPIIQNCDVGQGCYAINETFTCAPDASPEGAGIGTACEFLNACPPGLLCLDGENVPGCPAIGCCSPVCPVGGADPCPGLLPETECTPWFSEGPPKGDGLCLSAEPGVCVRP